MTQHVKISLALLVLMGDFSSAELDVTDPPSHGPTCDGMTKAHLSSFALNNTLLITVVDQIVMRKFGKSWVENVKSAGIRYWMVAALDPWTSRLLGHWGVKQCFNAPLDRLRYKGGSGRCSDVVTCDIGQFDISALFLHSPLMSHAGSAMI